MSWDAENENVPPAELPLNVNVPGVSSPALRKNPKPSSTRVLSFCKVMPMLVNEKVVTPSGRSNSSGSTGTVGSDFTLARLLEETLPPLRINTVLGYPGGSEVDVAVENGEVICRGMTAAPFFGGREPFVSWQKKNFVRVLFYTGDKRHEKLPDVPTLNEIFDKEKVPEASRRVA